MGSLRKCGQETGSPQKCRDVGEPGFLAQLTATADQIELLVGKRCRHTPNKNRYC